MALLETSFPKQSEQLKCWTVWVFPGASFLLDPRVPVRLLFLPPCGPQPAFPC